MNEIIEQLIEAPETQICPTIVERIKNIDFDNSETAASEMKSILDDSAKYALASDFAMNVMDMVYNDLLAEPED